MIDAAVGMIVHVGRDASGTRKVLSIVKVECKDNERHLRELWKTREQ